MSEMTCFCRRQLCCFPKESGIAASGDQTTPKARDNSHKKIIKVQCAKSRDDTKWAAIIENYNQPPPGKSGFFAPPQRMENTLESPARMSRLGIGPSFAALSISYFVATVALTIHFAPVLRFVAISAPIRIGIGATSIFFGLLLYGSGVLAMLKAYKADKLCTTGAFSICRHPIYSAWICFLVPGAACLANSLISLSTPLVMYVLFKLLINKEDCYLEEKFGADYLQYRKNTPEILPVGWITRAKT